MAYIESHQEIARHPKTLRLKRHLGVSKNEAIGILHQLWWWSMDFAPDGDLTRFDAEEIANAVDFEGDPEALINALVVSGWIDKNAESSAVSVHDWSLYGGKFVQRKLANAERMRNARAGNVKDTDDERADDVRSTCDAQDAHVQDECDARALISRTEQSRTELNDTPVVPKGTAVDDRFVQFWHAYPRKVGKEAARKSWRRLSPSESMLGDMLAALAEQCAQPKWHEEDGRFIPNPATWLNQGRWQDEGTNIVSIREVPGQESWRLRTVQY